MAPKRIPLKLRELTLVSAYDWQALYDENGDLITQGHNVGLQELADAAGIKLNEVAAYNFIDAYERNQFPDCLDEIKPD